jgi:tRNA1Val (adenine37-N6)-methyltransferase
VSGQPATTLDTILDLSLYQHAEGYRFSLDAVLLYSFVTLRDARGIADLGAGSGVVGLLLAKKYSKAHVTLVELQKGLYRLVERNIKLNGLEGRVEAQLADIRTLGGLHGLDAAVSNPPFRKPLTGRLSREDERAVARHELELTLPELARAAASVLKSRGRFYLVHLPERLADVVDVLREHRLEPKRVRFVHGRRGSEARIMLIEAVRHGRAGIKVESPLFVYEDDGKTYSSEVRRIYEE